MWFSMFASILPLKGARYAFLSSPLPYGSSAILTISAQSMWFRLVATRRLSSLLRHTEIRLHLSWTLL